MGLVLRPVPIPQVEFVAIQYGVTVFSIQFRWSCVPSDCMLSGAVCLLCCVYFLVNWESSGCNENLINKPVHQSVAGDAQRANSDHVEKHRLLSAELRVQLPQLLGAEWTAQVTTA